MITHNQKTSAAECEAGKLDSDKEVAYDFEKKGEER